MYLKNFLTTILVFLFALLTATAQDVTLNLNDIHQFKIDGDSNVRSWEADITKSEGTLVLSGVENLSLESLTPESFQSLQIIIEVDGIETGTGRLTRNLQNYLKVDDHPEITFNLNEIHSIERDENAANITAEGIINAAGKDHPVTMNVNAVVNGDGSVTFSGSQDLLMTYFDIDPPTAVMGTIRARDEIKILYEITFAK